MMPEVVLWDFGDTLADERWMRRAPDDCPAWPDAWLAVMAELADGWNVGTVSADDIHDALARRLGRSTDEVAGHARECCRRIRFFDTAWRIARERRRPQALVTVNPDIFERWIVDEYGLREVFDAIVVSAREGTADKPALCDAALARLGFTGERSQALLIDNRSDLVEAWRACGGQAYWFQGDERFAVDVAGLLP